jgi:hypothetical protein
MTERKRREAKSVFEEIFNDAELEADEELKTEAAAQLSEEERAMAEVAQELLRMERDMLLPGSEQGTADRVKRIGDFIEGKEF